MGYPKSFIRGLVVSILIFFIAPVVTGATETFWFLAASVSSSNLHQSLATPEFSS
jgi:hypothetical protein